MMKTSAVLIVGLIALAACNKKEENTTVKVSELAAYVGTWTKCVSFNGTHGTDFAAASSYRITIEINSDGTYSHNRWYFSGVNNCLGGENAISYQQDGEIDVTGDNVSMAGFKDVSFASDSTIVTVRNGTGTFLTDFNTHCSTAALPTGGGVGSRSDVTSVCNVGTALSFDDMNGGSYITYNALSVSGTTMTMSTPIDWEAGGFAAPTTATYTLTKQ